MNPVKNWVELSGNNEESESILYAEKVPMRDEKGLNTRQKDL